MLWGECGEDGGYGELASRSEPSSTTVLDFSTTLPLGLARIFSRARDILVSLHHVMRPNGGALA